jgi:hypothetical protein
MTAVCALTSGALLVSSCAFAEHKRAHESRAAYEDCLAEHEATPEDCDALRAQADADWDAYERAARRGWGCEPSAVGCRTPPAPPGDPHATHPY